MHEILRRSIFRNVFLINKFKTFGFLDTLKLKDTHTVHTVQLPYKYNFLSPSNITSRKKQQTSFLCSSLFSFRFDSSEFQGGALPLAPSYRPLTVLDTKQLLEVFVKKIFSSNIFYFKINFYILTAIYNYMFLISLRRKGKVQNADRECLQGNCTVTSKFDKKVKMYI